MKARSNCNNIMPYIQADAAFCMLDVNGNLKNQTKDNYTTIAITKTMEKKKWFRRLKILMIIVYLQLLIAGFLYR